MGTRSFVRYWLPVLAWMLVIFSASTDLMSGQRTSRFLGPLLRWIVPGISDADVRQSQFFIRKTGHVTEYAVLALLLWRARRKPVKGEIRAWNWREAAWSAGVAALYAASDEWHQTFVASRTGSVADVLIDTAGAVLGVGLLWLAGRWRKIW